ncbi:hypothetical protein FACS189426_21810 [Bacteroidia bacterium]|nr:hypothetical protein FACS189426_21810 [Bacteroidia bacterium]GHT84388.1 hypothetical protein FACS18947_1770 [Bacteroidia bacterium]
MLLFSFHCLQAQVTIGSGIEPRKAALLDLKTRQAGAVTAVTDNDNVTSGSGGGGLLLPRVQLKTISSLEPFILDTDLEFINNTDNLKEHLAGLMVYNITDHGPSSTLYPAVYTWNGAIWVTSHANEAVSSVINQPVPFTFYEKGTETIDSLTFKVDGLGTWTY